MAVTTGTMMALSSAVSIAGQLAEGRARRAAGDADTRVLQQQGRQQEDQALQEADRIRRSARKTTGAARAQMAASGIDVNSGTALDIEAEIVHDSERDAFNTLLTGKRRGDAARYAAAQAGAKGANGQFSSTLGAVSTGLQGWKGVKKAEPEYRYKVPNFDGAEY